MWYSWPSAFVNFALVSYTCWNLFVTLKSSLVVVLQLFTDMHRLKAVTNLSPQALCSQLRSKKVTFCLLVSTQAVNRSPYHGLFSAMFFHIFVFLGEGGFCRLKWPPSQGLKWCLSFQSTRRPWCALWRKHMCQISCVQAWVKCRWLWVQC